MRRLVCLALTLAVALFLGLGALSCDRTEADLGLDAALSVDGAQFFRGEMPGESGGPEVRSVTVASTFEAGAAERTCAGEIGREGTAVAIGLAGDLGYWILPAGVPSAAAVDAPTFTALFSLSPSMRAGPRELVVRAVDRERRFGPALVRPIAITERGVPSGELVISLAWDNHANLDLHVVDPNGVEIFKRNINSYEPPAGVQEPPGTVHDGGVLDFDSHADCVRDGRSAENVVWVDPPPKGRYLVRVDTFSLCGEAVARWRVQALVRGVRVASAEGVATEADVAHAHNRGAGILALELDVP